MRKLLLGIAILLIPFSLKAVNETGTSPGVDPCKSANPVPGCPRIVIPPRLLNPVRPDYPTHGRRKQGLVRIGTTITSDGELKDIQALSGDDELKQMALAAVRQWHYRPSSVNGAPVAVHHEIAISFTKKDGVLLGADDVGADLAMEPPEDWYQLLRTQALQRVGGNVKPPRTLSVRDPEYSRLAKRNHYEGICVLSLIVSENGQPKDIWVFRALGEGLDENAIAAVRRWTFQPATRNGQPVPVMINVEVQFRLY